MPLDLGHSSELPPGILDLDLRGKKDSLGNKLRITSTADSMLPTASVMETTQNAPWTNYPASQQSNRAPFMQCIWISKNR